MMSNRNKESEGAEVIQTILAFCGYTRIPKEAVQLSMLVEEGYRRLSKKLPNSEFSKLHESAKTITWFLRSGRLL